MKTTRSVTKTIRRVVFPIGFLSLNIVCEASPIVSASSSIGANAWQIVSASYRFVSAIRRVVVVTKLIWRGAFMASF
jgi:hypothetical protein